MAVIQTPGGASQLVLDAVLHGAPQIAPQGTHVLRLEPLEPCKRVMQDILCQIARGDPAAGPLWQPSPHPTSHPRRIPREQHLDGRGTPPSRPFQNALVGTTVVGNALDRPLRWWDHMQPFFNRLARFLARRRPNKVPCPEASLPGAQALQGAGASAQARRRERPGLTVRQATGGPAGRAADRLCGGRVPSGYALEAAPAPRHMACLQIRTLLGTARDRPPLIAGCGTRQLELGLRATRRRAASSLTPTGVLFQSGTNRLTQMEAAYPDLLTERKTGQSRRGKWRLFAPGNLRERLGECAGVRRPRRPGS